MHVKKRPRRSAAVLVLTAAGFYLRRRFTASPIKPMPRRPKVAGSGTDTDPVLVHGV